MHTLSGCSFFYHVSRFREDGSLEKTASELFRILEIVAWMKGTLVEIGVEPNGKTTGSYLVVRDALEPTEHVDSSCY
jgi:hypothetical protein